jgi:hypothetical protein
MMRINQHEILLYDAHFLAILASIAIDSRRILPTTRLVLMVTTIDVRFYDGRVAWEGSAAGAQ